MKQLMDHFLAALAEEIEAVRKDSFRAATALKKGVLREKTPQGNLYTFPFKNDVRISDETPILVSVNGTRSGGVVVGSTEDHLAICVKEDFGSEVAAASLTTDETKLLVRLADRLRKIRDGAPDVKGFNTAMVKKVLGLSKSRTGKGKLLTALDGALNASQLDSVRKALGSEVAYLWGPPGTGKSHTLARVIHEHYLRGRRILIFSNSNQAVDSLLSAVCRVISQTGDAGFQRGAVLRRGTISDPELSQQYGDYVAPERVVARLTQELEREKSKLQSQCAEWVKNLATLEEVVKAFPRRDKLVQQELTANKARKAAELGLATLQTDRQKLTTDAKELAARIQEAEAKGPVGRFFRGIKPERLRRQQSKLQAELDAYAGRERSAREGLDQAATEHQRTEARRKEADQCLMGRSIKEVRAARTLEEKNLAELREKIKALNEQIGEVRKEVPGNCRVSAATATKAYLTEQEFPVADVVVVDEASMLVLPSVAYVAGLALEAVIIAGDFRQLPPIVRAKGSVAKEWLGTDVFEKAGIVAAVNGRKSLPALLRLDTQYRMDERVCKLINEPFYGGDLRTGAGAGSTKAPHEYAPLLRENLVLIDTSSQNPIATRAAGGSRYNILHAVILRNILIYLRRHGLPAGPKDVGIISPYRLQAKLLQQMCEEMGWEEITAGTVHKFQGAEKDIIFFDVTDSTGVFPSPFTDASSTEQDGAKLLNVAFSRARSRMVFIANMDYVEKRLSKETFLRQALETVRAQGAVVDAADFVDIGRENPDFSVFGEVPDESLSRIYSELDYEAPLLRDVERAQESVVIFSGFSTHQRIGKWKALLSMKVAQGVKVRCVTRDPDDQPSIDVASTKQALKSLLDGNVIIDFRHQIHEKAVVVDGNILWYGSLNPLSHNGMTNETLLRLVSRGVCVAFADNEIYERKKLYKAPRKEREQVILRLLAERENPECGECGSFTVLHTKGGRHGPFYTCARNDRCDWSRLLDEANPGKEPAAERGGRNGYGKKGVKACPACGGQLFMKADNWGKFLGCGEYPSCEYKENVFR